jgi:hypothetical protein
VGFALFTHLPHPKQILLNSKNQAMKKRTTNKPMKAQAWAMQADS